MSLIYFETIAEAEEFAKKHKLKNYCFYTPMYLENGVDLSYDENELAGEIDG